MKARVLHLLLWLPLCLPGQSMNLGKGSEITVRIPEGAFVLENPKSAYSALLAEVVAIPDNVLVNGNPRWRSAGFPSARPMKVSGWKVDKKKEALEVTLDQRKGPDLKVRMSLEDTTRVFGALFGPASDSASAHKAARESLTDELFGDPILSAVPQEEREGVLQVLEEYLGSAPLMVDSLRGRRWFVVPLGEGTYTFNTNQTNEAERYAGVINEVAFPAIQRLGRTMRATPDSVGFVVEVVAKSKDMAGRYAWLNSTKKEAIRFFVSAKDAREFADAEITSQDLADRSTIMRGDVRIKIDLTK